jgi:hypothetical protein
LPSQHTTNRQETEQVRRVRAMAQRVEQAYERAHGKPLTRAQIALEFNVSDETARSWMAGRRPLGPDVVLGLARLARLNPAELYVELGWLGEPDLAHYAAGRVASADTGDLLSEVPGAPLVAARALFGDPVMRGRFSVHLTTLEAGTAYPTTTDAVARFALREDAEPLPPAAAEAEARVARIVATPSRALLEREPAYCSVRLELAAFLAGPLRWCGQYTWQGEPGSRTWRPFTPDWPAQILVQDIVSGVSRQGAAEPWTARTVRPLVFIGGRYSTGMAASFAAQGLGWQYLLVHSGASIDAAGQVAHTRRDWGTGPAEAWSEAAAHLRERAVGGSPWPVVLSVRPQSFLTAAGEPDHSALEQLRRCEARVVYVRPRAATLEWWTRRQIGLSPDGEYAREAVRARRRLLTAFAEIERALELRGKPDRRGDEGDLMLYQPDASASESEAWDPYRPEPPDELVDGQVRLAWQALTWLGRTTPHAAKQPTAALHTGVLDRYQARLAAAGAMALPGL